MEIGFTGTRKGMTAAQLNTLARELRQFSRPIGNAFTAVHHGDCVGADEQFHQYIRKNYPAVFIHIHPPYDNEFRAFCDGDDAEEPKEYLTRNRDIVDASQCILAVPDGPEKNRSGTWYTIRYARRIGRRVMVILPTETIHF